MTEIILYVLAFFGAIFILIKAKRFFRLATITYHAIRVYRMANPVDRLEYGRSLAERNLRRVEWMLKLPFGSRWRRKLETRQSIIKAMLAELTAALANIQFPLIEVSAQQSDPAMQFFNSTVH